MITHPQLRVVLMLVIWGVVWSVAWTWLSRPRPVTRIELSSTASLLSVSDTGLASIVVDSGAPIQTQRSMAKVWNLKTGRECPLPYRPGDVLVNYGLSYQYPCFVLRDGCVHQIDAITGETIQRYEEVRSAIFVQTSPDRTRLLVQKTLSSYDLFDVSAKKIKWTFTQPEPISLYWTYDDFLLLYTSRGGSLRVNASTGQVVQNGYAGSPLQMATIDGEIISADSYGEAELAVYKSDKLWLKLPFIRSKIGLPTRNQLRFSADGSSLLLDYVNKSGKVSTANWKLNEQAAHEHVSFSPFRVAANGYVLESRTYERPKWLKNLQRIGRLGIDATPDEILYSTVFDQKGRRLLQVEHSFADPNYLEDFAAFTEGGQGLVIYNNSGIEYYRVPPHGPYHVLYWLGLLATPVVGWGMRRWRRGIPQPAATID